MKVDSIIDYSARSNSMPYQFEHESVKGKVKTYNESVQKNSESLKRGYNGGSFTGKEKAAANFLDKLFELCDHDSVIGQNLVALVLAGIARPATLLAFSGDKDREDNIYASGHAMASALIGFVFSVIFMAPLSAAAKKIKGGAINPKTGKPFVSLETLKKIYNCPDAKTFKDLGGRALNNTTRILDMGPDTFVFGIIKAMLTIALIPPILKYVFHIEKNKKPAQTPVYDQVSFASAKRPDMDRFMGGAK